jgi:pyruvate/2-oxoglutarate dehydrogenase complex dihydrolipoamide acyltransferase (E2) component
MAQNISVPDIGDFDSVEIIEVLIKVGDQVNENDPIVTLESDKSSVEVPSPFSGKIVELNVKVGDKVSKGTLLAKLKSSESNANKIEKNSS